MGARSEQESVSLVNISRTEPTISTGGDCWLSQHQLPKDPNTTSSTETSAFRLMCRWFDPLGIPFPHIALVVYTRKLFLKVEPSFYSLFGNLPNHT